MILAAVAGLAALAVTIVARTVGETGDQLADSDPRLAAAKIAGEEVVHDAASAAADRFDTWGAWQEHFRRRCTHLVTLYIDTGAEVTVNEFRPPQGAAASDPFDAALARSADEQPPGPGRPQAACEVG